MDDLIPALRAIAEGYSFNLYHDRYIVVENPLFEEGERHSPNLLIDVWEVEQELK